jgi:curved DNA-binding protein CbpA
VKDYYYILGLKQTATTEEVKKAYRKLSKKFHPDINDGDEFFADRFKEIQEAYETLIDLEKRQSYDKSFNSDSSNKQNNHGSILTPNIEYFKSNKSYFEYDEEIIFSWKTNNSDKVILKPIGVVKPSGHITYKIKNFKSRIVTFELIAENSRIDNYTKSYLTLSNKTYEEFYTYFLNKFQSEERKKSSQKVSSNTIEGELDKYLNIMIGFMVILILGIIIIFYLQDNVK